SLDNVANWDDALIEGWDACGDAVVPNASEAITSTVVTDRPSGITHADNFVEDIDDQDLISAADSVAPAPVTSNVVLTDPITNHHEAELNSVEAPTEQSTLTTDQPLPANQQCFIHELLLEAREQNCRVEERLKEQSEYNRLVAEHNQCVEERLQEQAEHNRRVEERLQKQAEHNRHVEERLNVQVEHLRRTNSHIDQLLTNSVEHGQIHRLIHGSTNSIAEQVKKIDSGRLDEIRERQLTVTLLSSINNAVLGGGRA
ncbi:hypothetical protein M9458_054353, partial [Cirrhinus mrigala]